ncbi:MAG: FtsX-like permease family protein [Rhodanobacter sp.]|nr:MAG: FtsX-like permease family protein [Rhodanobacter sp.]TAL94407.1 MAG: FtsX-like permease family protein [Rhodanobacter sp.]TAM41947.1 MAG: FtsX-like permease family protein [Rhodanobacter sp.]TAN29236.1 MAG: FtsX-like permease family protein [Rhodanobacter sp.]
MKKFLLNLGLVVLVILAVYGWTWLPWFGALVLALAFAAWLALSRSGRQAASVTAVGVSTIRQRAGSSSVIVIGIAGVVAVLVALLAMGEGLTATLESGGRTDTAIVLRGGAAAESASVLTHDDVLAVEQAPGIARDASGKPIASAELVVAASVKQKGSDDDANAQLRGVDPEAWALRPNLKIIEGRKFQPGLRELDVGQGAARQFAGMAIGDEVKLGTESWKVVGVFASGDAYDSEMWSDRQTVASAYRRGNSAESVLVKLTSAAAFDTFHAALASDPKLKVEASTTKDYFAKQSAGLARVIRMVGLTVGIIMAIGAIFGALNCMFAAVASRAREIATLRAIGFRSVPVVVSVMLETMLLALIGGVLGALIVWLVFNGYTTSTLSGLTQLVFRFYVSPQLLWEGLKWALAIGFIGGLFPAVRAARLPVTTALRES